MVAAAELLNIAFEVGTLAIEMVIDVVDVSIVHNKNDFV
jgi:hypothetical protein